LDWATNRVDCASNAIPVGEFNPVIYDCMIAPVLESWYTMPVLESVTYGRPEFGSNCRIKVVL
jgi:hypothetical protein